MAEADIMQFPKPAPNWSQFNINTILSVVQLFGMLGGLVYVYVDKSRDIDDLKSWVTNHEQYHKDRLIEVKAAEAATNERFRVAENKFAELDKKVENLTYRVTVSEQSAVSVASSIKDLYALVNKQGGDILVVKEILQRMEARGKGKISDISCPDDRPVWGSRNGIYHVIDSPYRGNMVPRICFATVEEAEASGYRAPKERPLSMVAGAGNLTR